MTKNKECEGNSVNQEPSLKYIRVVERRGTSRQCLGKFRDGVHVTIWMFFFPLGKPFLNFKNFFIEV